MQIAVLGTGGVGRALAGRFAELGHDVTMGTRSPQATAGRDDHREWAADHPSVALATYADATAGAEVVVNATSGDVSLDVLTQAGDLAGKVLIDLSNPLDFSAGFPPTLFVKDTDSLGERIQAAFPAARVVKTLHTMNNSVMVDPGSVGRGDHTVFVAGDDAEAKGVVTGLLTAMGHTDVLDLGDISASRGTEMMMPIWLRLMSTLGTGNFNFKIVR